jgi:uncharacterized BrkB/YihY/UPF0761 family membrane protein
VILLREIGNRLNSDDCTDVAAQVSFYFILSLFPFFLALAANLILLIGAETDTAPRELRSNGASA